MSVTTRPNPLLETPFALLGATARDNRRRIIELTEEKQLTLEHDLCVKARGDLTNPRSRLSCEIAWLPGVSPTRANAYCSLLNENLGSFLERAQEETALVRVNLLAAALQALDDAYHPMVWASAVLELSLSVDDISPEEVLRAINEDRMAAGFPEIRDISMIEAELAQRRRQLKDVINSELERLSTEKVIEAITLAVEDGTAGGKRQGPLLLDEIIDSFADSARPFLERESANIDRLLGAIREAALLSERAVKPLLDRLDQVLENWGRVTRPIQQNLAVRGLSHDESQAVVARVRSVGVDLFNKHGMLSSAQHITDSLQEKFLKAPEVAEALQEDAHALAEIARAQSEQQREIEKWQSEIAYEAEFGLIFKNRVRISASGIEWKGVCYPLDSITAVRWGAVRSSVNGIPTGTDYIVGVATARTATSMELGREQIYTNFVERLWRAVCVRLVGEMLMGLKEGKRFQFGDAVVDDTGVELVKHKVLRNERVRTPWIGVTYGAVNGSLIISAQDDKKTYVSMSYRDVWNVHILEAVIRGSLKEWRGRLSGLLDKVNGK